MTTSASVPAPATVLVFLDTAFENGRIADSSAPQLMATDQGATRGDGVFESLLAVGGKPRKLQAHLSRLAGSARALELDIPAEDAWRHAIETAIGEFRSQAGPAGSSADEADEVVVKLLATRSARPASTSSCWTAAMTARWANAPPGCCSAPKPCPTPSTWRHSATPTTRVRTMSSSRPPTAGSWRARRRPSCWRTWRPSTTERAAAAPCAG